MCGNCKCCQSCVDHTILKLTTTHVHIHTNTHTDIPPPPTKTKTVEGSLPRSLSVGVSEDNGIEHRREEVNWTGPEKRNIELAH